jgi:hypothetical protein
METLWLKGFGRGPFIYFTRTPWRIYLTTYPLALTFPHSRHLLRTRRRMHCEDGVYASTRRIAHLFLGVPLGFGLGGPLGTASPTDAAVAHVIVARRLFVALLEVESKLAGWRAGGRLAQAAAALLDRGG